VINYDAAATVVAHMIDVTAVPAHYDGMPQGNFIITPPPAVLTDDLVVYLPFNGDYLDDTWVETPLWKVIEDHQASIAKDPGTPDP
jgi:hypothetical protein